MDKIETTLFGVMAGRKAYEFFLDKIDKQLDKLPPYDNNESKKCYLETIVLTACARLSHLVSSPEEFEQRMNTLIEMINDIGGEAGESAVDGGGG